jgi:hypothetical protein
MLSQWLCIVVYHVEPVIVNHGVLFWVSGCESWCAMLSQWLWIMVSITSHNSQPLTQHYTPWFTTFGRAWQSMIHNHWLRITHNESQPLAQLNTTWLSTTGSAYGLLYCAKGCELWRVTLSQWLSVMVCYTEPVDVTHGEIYCASSCE